MKKKFLRNISIALVAIVLGLTSSNFSAKAASTSKTRFRYVRDWCGESLYYYNNLQVHLYGQWREIQVTDSSGKNIALGKTVTGQEPVFPTDNGLMGSECVTDGIFDRDIDKDNRASYFDYGTHYVVVDLGSIYNNINSITVWHEPGVSYEATKTEISEDGVNWTTVYEGDYAEGDNGHTISLS